MEKFLPGMKVGKWTILENSGKKSYCWSFFWLCKCECGTERLVTDRSLQQGRSQSCGCSRLKVNRREKFFRSRYKVLENGCWEWLGCRDNDGYGRFGRNQKAYRYSYEKIKGEIPNGMCVCHSCDNRGCVNPDHLWLGTDRQNQKDKTEKQRQAMGENQGAAKLTNIQVSEIKKKLKEKVFHRILAVEYGVSKITIDKIANGTSWIHIK